MKQLDMFEEITKDLNSKIPSYEEWYSENSRERRQYGEKPYTKQNSIRVYRHLIKIGFFHKRGK